MVVFTDNLLVGLPVELNWVKGVFYILEMIWLCGLTLSPFLMIFSIRKKK